MELGDDDVGGGAGAEVLAVNSWVRSGHDGESVVLLGEKRQIKQTEIHEKRLLASLALRRVVVVVTETAALRKERPQVGMRTLKLELVPMSI